MNDWYGSELQARSHQMLAALLLLLSSACYGLIVSLFKPFSNTGKSDCTYQRTSSHIWHPQARSFRHAISIHFNSFARDRRRA